MSDLSELLTDHDVGHAPPTARWPGVYPALVTDIVDPDGQGRVKVSLPWSPDGAGSAYAAWARLATLAGGPNRGSWFVPEHGDEVLVAFEAGDPRRPYVLGGLWNGSDAPPQSMDSAGNNYKKVIKTRNGVTVTLDDTDGSEQLLLETPGGQQLTLADGPGSITLQDANGNSIKLDPSGVTVTRRREGDRQRGDGRDLGRDADRQRRHVDLQRRRQGRHGDHQFGRLGLLHARARGTSGEPHTPSSG